MNATSPSSCKACPPRTYAPATGSSKCIECPSGSACPGDKTSEYTPCAVGRYNSFPGQIECQACPSGKYGPRVGSAICLDCPLGTFRNTTGAITFASCLSCAAGKYASKSASSECTDCPAGRYQKEDGQDRCEICQPGTSSPYPGQTNCSICTAGRYSPTNGSSLCLQCSKGHYQSLDGQSECSECTSTDGRTLMTNSLDFKSCVVERVLEGPSSIAQMLFTDNVAYIVSFIISAIFAALCGLMQYMRAGDDNTMQGRQEGEVQQKVGQLSIFLGLVKGALPGFSFGSEAVLIIGIMPVSPILAGTMIVFRLVHIVATLFLITILFGSKSTREYLRNGSSAFLKEAVTWSELFHYDFAKSKIPITGVMLILCACDISLVQMLPWNNTAFFKESKGFPSKSLMRFALGADMVQASVSALCSIIYIGSAMSADAKNPTTSSQAQVFFGLNITVSLLTVIVSFVLLYLKDRLLQMTDEGAKGEGGEEGGGSGRVEGVMNTRRESVEVELGGIYRGGGGGIDGDDELPSSGADRTFSNPMHSAEVFHQQRVAILERDDQLEAKAAEILRKDEQIRTYKRKIEVLEEEKRRKTTDAAEPSPELNNAIKEDEIPNGECL